MHDHTQPAASNKGINPGGDHTAIVYKDFLGADGLPIDQLGGHSAHSVYFNPEYYQGKLPVFDPKIFDSTIANYEKGWPDAPPAGGAFDYPRREAAGGAAAARPDRRRAPSPGGVLVRGAAAQHAPHRGEGRPAICARGRGVRVRAARDARRALRGGRDRSREQRRGPPRPDDPGAQPDVRAQRGRAGHRRRRASSRPTRTSRCSCTATSRSTTRSAWSAS